MYLVVDSSVWISSFITSERHHREADRFVLDALNGKHRIIVPTIFLSEVMSGLSRRFKHFERDRDFLNDVATDLFLSPFIHWKTVDRSFSFEAAACGMTHGLREMDAIFAATAIYYQIPLLTEDDEFDRANSAVRVLRLKDIIH